MARRRPRPLAHTILAPFTREEILTLAAASYDTGLKLAPRSGIALRLRGLGLLENDPTCPTHHRVTEDGEEVVRAYRRAGWLRRE